MTDPNTRSRTCARETEVDAVLARAGVHRNFPGSAEPWVRWGVATQVWAGLAGPTAAALALRASRDRCRAGDWQPIVQRLLDLDLPDWAYDAAVDVLHAMANLPCTCTWCVAAWEGKQVVAERQKQRAESALAGGRYILRRF